MTSSMDICQQFLCCISIVVHHHFDSLRIDVLCANEIVFMFDVWELIRKTLFVEVFFTGVSLVLDNVVGHHNIIETSVFARVLIDISLFVALPQAMRVASFDHVLGILFNVLETALIKSFFHFKRFYF